MDGLALLCNLHADGPVSLRRLREAGLGRLEEVSRLDEDLLAKLLGSSRPQARRFAREARQLGERVYESPREETVPTPEPFGAEHAAHGEPALAPGPARGRWTLAADGALRFQSAARLRSAAGLAPRPPVAHAVVPDPAGDARLSPGRIEGLDAVVCRKLVEVGVRSLESLVEVANLSLARRIGMPFPRLLDLQYRARQELLTAARTPVHAPALAPVHARGREKADEMVEFTVRPLRPAITAYETTPREELAPPRKEPSRTSPPAPGAGGPFA